MSLAPSGRRFATPMPNCFRTRHERLSGMRIPSHPPIRPGSQARVKAEHSDAIKKINRVESVKLHRQNQETDQTSDTQKTGLPAATRPAKERSASFGRWQHSVPFLAQFISQAHWSRPRRASAPAPQDANGAYASADNLEHSTRPASYARTSRIV